MIRPLLALLVCIVTGCSHGSAGVDAGEAQPAPSAAASARPTRVVALDAISRLDDCVLGHRGALLDLGDASSRARFVSSLDAPSFDNVEREGATWARVTKRSVSFTFYWSGLLDRPPPLPPPGPVDASAPIDSGTYVEARVHSVTARSASVYLNGHLVGGWSLSRGKDVVAARTAERAASSRRTSSRSTSPAARRRTGFRSPTSIGSTSATTRRPSRTRPRRASTRS